MGRAPTSGYCENCRKRRVKCDKTTPHCLRCTRGGLECKGYDLPLRMQSHGLVTDQRGKERMVKLPNPPTSSTAATAASSSSSSSSTATTMRTRTAPRLAPQVASSEEYLMFSYFFRNYVWAHFWRPIMRMMHVTSTDVAYTASLAIATGVKGLQSDDAALKVRALDLYGNAITSFRQQFDQAVGHKQQMASLGTTVIVLSLFTYAFDGSINLIDNNGLVTILQYCGPETFQEEPLLTVFRSCRANILCRSIDQGEGTFLEEPEWKRVPWLRYAKTPDDKLQDIIVHLPSISEAFRTGVPSQKRSLELVGQLDNLSSQLDTWRWEWEVANPGAATVGSGRGYDTSTISEPALAGLLSSRIDMQSITQGLDINLYNTIRAYMSRQRQILLGLGRKSKDDRRLSPEDMQFLEMTASRHTQSPLLLPGEAKLPCQYAIEAARLLPFLEERLATRIDDVALMVSPTWIIFSALRAQPELEAWVWTLRSSIHFLRGPNRDLTLFDIFR